MNPWADAGVLSLAIAGIVAAMWVADHCRATRDDGWLPPLERERDDERRTLPHGEPLERPGLLAASHALRREV